MPIQISDTECQFEREPLIRPFGLKGGYMNSIWQVAARMESSGGVQGMGLGTQNVLWSDRRVFTSTAEAEGNCLMFAITAFALRQARGRSFDTPIDLQEQIFDEVYAYGQKITGQPGLNKTFVLNAMVAVDNAAWMVYARENGLSGFDDLIPAVYRPAFTHRHDKVASIPIASYGMPLDEVQKLVEVDGYIILKFKLGSPGSQQEMLEQDKARIEQVHKAVGHIRVSHTKDGKLPYYFDPNGRYESKDTLSRLLDHAKKIGAFDQVYILEEPFPEEYTMDVGDLGVLVAADESAHTAENVGERIQMGYGAIALKAAAKTLSMTMKMALTAHRHDIPCFCADLTVNPVLVDWNKNVAARLGPVPGFDVGLLETNGHQNYKRWETMKSYHPRAGSPWIDSQEGVFHLDDDFYDCSGGILEESPHYRSILNMEPTS
ncbi:MAG: mandelate racemase/muconate lactonizing enzyme family protein [Balneolales bacterium]